MLRPVSTTVSLASAALTLVALLPWMLSARAEESSAPDAAGEILAAAGVQGGILVHLDCGDGRLTAALGAEEGFTVHGLETDAELVAAARRHIQSLDMYGRVSVEQFSGTALPYSDNLINLIVVEEPERFARAELLRVLVPRGVACIREDGNWQRVVKPRPGDIDDWSHFLHDASNNAVARDTVVGPPRRLQWAAPPLWLRSHETPSGIQAPVSAGGRLFYLFDQGLIGITDERLPDRWALVCRDAFNGRLLWQRSLEAWGWRAWSRERYAGKDWTTLRAARTDVPDQNQRRIVADAERLYATLSYRGPVSILNATTGQTLSTVAQTDGASELLVSEGVLLVYTQQTPGDLAQRRGTEDQAGTALVAADSRTGKVLWHQPCPAIRPLALAIDNGRVVYLAGGDLVALDLKSGQLLWSVQPKKNSPRTLLTVDDVIVIQGGSFVAAHDATTGRPLWENAVVSIGGAEGEDLFVIDGLVYRGMQCVDEDGQPAKKSPHAMVTGWDLHTGQERTQIQVNNLRSPEHHHRCYRNKATTRYLISSFEGAEFLDFQADNHSPNNWLRGACKNGMMPCNGMLYVPPDQCFCQPGAKLLGYSAVTAGPDQPERPVPDESRLEKGPAYGKASESNSRAAVRPAAVAAGASAGDSWPTFRHDAARSGTTAAAVPAAVSVAWKTRLGGRLTSPVAADGRVFVAARDAHTVYALDAADGHVLWQYTSGGRVDSPPTIHDGLVLFGSADGRVTCLRAADGELVWRFLAAPTDRRIAVFDQLESAWPVHGSVLLTGGVAYCTAGRSTYLDGGIRLFGLDPATGRILHRGLLEGPHRSVDGQRDVAFYVLGANSDVLVAQDGFLYMRQKKLTPELQEIEVPVLSSKGAQDVGLHVFSTAGLLDDSWYNRTFWMYAQRWPGFQLANQAPKSGQLLVMDDQQTYAVRVFYRRNTHSPMFFPETEGYLVFADRNTNEPQIVGEPGSREPIRWLPQSDYSRGRGDEVRALDSEAFGLDKMVGYTRAEPPVWMTWLPVRVRAMVKAGETLFAAGAPDVLDPEDPLAAFEGRRGARLVALSAADGRQLSELDLEHPPVFDGLIAAEGRLYAALQDGSLIGLHPMP
jgi:outer membrane protein assembly factor BamB